MKAALQIVRLGGQLRAMREQRGLTQMAVAKLAGVPRLKIIQVESGRPTVSVEAYARVGAALGAELQLAPARRPTLDELPDLLK